MEKKEINKQENFKIKILFVGLILELYTVLMIGQLNRSTISIGEFVTQSLIFILIVLVILAKKDLKIFSILFFTLVYGTLIIYHALLGDSAIKAETEYLWLISIPIIGITVFFLISRIEYVLNFVAKKEIENNLITIDEITGYELEGALIKDLKKEMVKTKRHKCNLSVMLVEVQYTNELKKLYSTSEVNEIYLAIANSINKLARLEDMKYRYKEDQFILVLPFTNVEGIEIVKKRFKENLKNIKISSIGKGEDILTFKYKIAIKEYDGISDDPIEFLNAIEKELEYDV